MSGLREAFIRVFNCDSILLILLIAITAPRSDAAENALRTILLPPNVKALEAPGLHNLFAVGTNVFSGSTPENDAAFAALAKLGAKTIISVDGAKPDVEMARKHGLRYVHLPHGYDGISTNLQLQLAKAGETLPGPFYVHCHHGKHRGPTAVAVMCMANGGWTASQAEAWMHAAGTASNYAGLFETVRRFQKPSLAHLEKMSTSFPETAQVSGLVDSMVQIDEQWEHLQTVRQAGYAAPKNHPDLKPANEALILWEHYREAQRLAEPTKHGADFIGRLKAAETEAKEAERLLREFTSAPRAETRAQLDKNFDAMKQSCVTCPKKYRDPDGIKSRP
jgi:protein tyrosine phosphatase (PTP) superfamily phosphohydrolase (DUF442 family)